MQVIVVCPFCNKLITHDEIRNTSSVGYSKGRQVKQYFHNKCMDEYLKKGAKK